MFNGKMKHFPCCLVLTQKRNGLETTTITYNKSQENRTYYNERNYYISFYLCQIC